MNEPDERAVSALQTMAAPWAYAYAAERSTPVEEPLATPQAEPAAGSVRSEAIECHSTTSNPARSER